ncbi:YkvA family protein [Knoellia sp. LjRoot47]|uniref:YkvA family protein n=1 Tax=Knoellia sp. LjRoot47 TaxID=3342330 RepID=UPI003ECE155F
MAMASKVTTFKSLATAIRIATRPGGPSMVERAQAVPRLVRAVRSGEYTGTSVGRLLMIAGAAGYLVSPVDLLPEALLGAFGLADDAVVGSWLAAQLVTETEAFLEWERRTGRGTGHGAGADPVPGVVVDDAVRGGSVPPRA